MAPSLYDVNVCLAPNPITYVWEAGRCVANNKELLTKLSITKREYEEQGIAFCIDKFDVY